MYHGADSVRAGGVGATGAAERGSGDLAERVAGRLAAAGVGPGDGVVVALSGGGDSVALLHVLASLAAPLALRLTAAHLHHGLRGADADRDLVFARRLCARLGLTLVEARADVAAEAGARGISPEMAGRVARQRFLALARAQVGARFVALAHHADDQAETVLLRLGRGSGMLGAGAMTAAGPGAFVRPLLGERRTTLRAYLEAIGEAWREDATNAEPGTPRNRLRLAVLPAWEAADPGVGGRLARSATLIREDAELLAAAVSALLPPPRRDNGGPWRAIPWALWATATVPLRRQLLRQAAWSVSGLYPSALWAEAWARWPETVAARPDLAWLRVARAAEAAVVFRPGTAAEIALPTDAAPWRLALPDGASLAAEAGPPRADALTLGVGAAARRPRPGERLGRGGEAPSVRETLRRRGVPAPCRAGAWLVAGEDGAWLPAGAAARQAVRAGGQAFDLVWRAAPALPDPGAWPAPPP